MIPRSLLLALVCALLLPAAASAARGPCVPGQSKPVCNFKTAHVEFVADGDTIRVRGAGFRGLKTIRFTGINAMELHRYSKYADRRRGECHGVEATNLIDGYIKRAGRKVRLADQREDSKSGERLRRTVWVKSGGRWVDLGKEELKKGLVLWLPNGVEWAHNDEYHRLAAQARAAGRGLYDPDSCGAGPSQDAQLRIWANWDADSNDEQNLNDEWVQIVNDGSSDLSLRDWWLRDSWLNWAKHKTVPGYPFPSDASVPAGGSIRVHVGCGSNTATNLYWCQKDSAFENVTSDGRNLGDGAYLFDPQGDLRVSFMYPCVLECNDPALGRAKVDVRPNGDESVSVTNTGAGDLSLFGYLLKIHNPGVRDSFIASYQFGPSAVLAAGQTVRIGVADDWGLGPNKLRDSGPGAVSLRSFEDVVIDCHAWGGGDC